MKETVKLGEGVADMLREMGFTSVGYTAMPGSDGLFHSKMAARSGAGSVVFDIAFDGTDAGFASSFAEAFGAVSPEAGRRMQAAAEGKPLSAMSNLTPVDEDTEEAQRVFKAMGTGKAEASEYMAGLFYSDTPSTYGMYEDLAGRYLYSFEEKREGIDEACRLLLGYGIGEIADDLIGMADAG